jgi:hypothetical protein
MHIFSLVSALTTPKQHCLHRRSRRRAKKLFSSSLLFYASTHVYEFQSEKCTQLSRRNFLFQPRRGTTVIRSCRVYGSETTELNNSLI